MKLKRFVAIVAALISPLIAASFNVKKSAAQAAVAPPYHEGTSASGIILKEEDCPIVVRKESLNLKISSLPAVFDKENAEDCAGEAEIKYHFYNPQSTDYEMTLLSPYGVRPSYLPVCGEDDRFGSYVGESAVNGKLRHTYNASYFQLHEDSERVSDEKREGFCTENSTIKKYVYTMNTEAADNDYYFRMRFLMRTRKSHIFFEDEENTRIYVQNGNLLAKVRLGREEGEKKVVFYVAGDSVSILSATIANGRDSLGEGLGDPQISTLTFSELAMKDYSAESGIGETDWYNAFLDMLESKSDSYGSVLGINLNANSFMRWYEYTINVPAKEEVVNTVKVPLYPTVEGNKNPRYEYSFLLSAAEKWSEVNLVEIKINTPYYLSHSSFEFSVLEERDGTRTYSLSRSYLPQGDITFVLTEKDGADTAYDTLDDIKFSSPTLNWASIVLIVLAVISVGIAIAMMFYLRKKKK